MTLRAKHSKNSTVPDGADTNQVRPSDWNADHPIKMAGPALAGRTGSGDGDAEEIELGADLKFEAGKLEVAVLDAPGGSRFAPGFRGIPQVVQNANATLSDSDSDKHWIKTDANAYAWTIPANADEPLPVGFALPVINDNAAGNVTLTRGSGVALLDGATDANYVLAPNTARTLLKVGTNRWRVL